MKYTLTKTDIYIKVCHHEDTGSNSHVIVPWRTGIKYLQSLCPQNVSKYAAVDCKIYIAAKSSSSFMNYELNHMLTTNLKPCCLLQQIVHESAARFSSNLNLTFNSRTIGHILGTLGLSPDYQGTIIWLQSLYSHSDTP